MANPFLRYAAFLALAGTISSCQPTTSENTVVSKFEWYASESAPKEYPVYLLTSFLVLRDGAIEGLPSDRVVSTGWGELGSIQLIGDPFKASPETLDIRWFDLIARKGYGGEIALDSGAIEDQMRAGLRNQDGGDAHRIEALLFGMAPGGELAIWVSGGRVTHLVSMHKLPSITIALGDMSNNPEDTLASFSDGYLELLFPDGLAAGRSPPPDGQWQEYARRTSFRPLVTGEFAGDVLWITFRNGETDWFDLTGKRDYPTSAEASDLALPVKADFNWSGPTGRKFVAQVEFDSKEVSMAFEALTERTEARPLILEFEPVESTLSVDVFLRAGDSFYKFERTRSLISGA